MEIKPVELQAEATKRYLTDPEFHARVNIVLQLNHWTSQHESGMILNDTGISWTRQAAAYALLVVEMELPQDFIDEAIPSMKDVAEAMGYTVVQRDGTPA